MNGFVTGECPNSCAYSIGWQCLALTPEQRAWRVKRISGAYCTQKDLFTYISQGGGMGRAKPTLSGREG